MRGAAVKLSKEAMDALSLAATNARDTLRAVGIAVDGVMVVIALPSGPVAIAGVGCTTCIADLVEKGPSAMKAWADGMRAGAVDVVVAPVASARKFDA